ncbi:MAG: acetyl-CoA carboxylase carboxyl transferase subunit alpha, partial [Candidatus Omnitrophica bacterium]|nr:acetyl-CoA carboxylase carboxyl transferase subunit alpha [Candidatus Omnitrophota bacterium]
ISPEGCAAILWKERSKAPEAAESLKLTGDDLYKLGIIDEIIPEPLGGAHRNPEEIAQSIKKIIKRDLETVKNVDKNDLVKKRYDKFRKMGIFEESKPE